MSLFLATLAMAAAAARVDSVGLTSIDSRIAVRVAISGRPGRVSVQREGNVARVSIRDAELGPRFAAGHRFSWTAPDGSETARLSRLEVAAGPGEVTVRLFVPADTSLDVRRDLHGLLLLLRTEVLGTTQAPAPAPAASLTPAPTKLEQPAARETQLPPPPEEPAPAVPAPPASDTDELARGLFPPRDETPPQAGSSIGELYPRLFPSGAPEAPGPAAATEAVDSGATAGVPLGPLRVRASLDARYVNADTFLESSSQPTRDAFLEVSPKVQVQAPLSEGRLLLGYEPVFRAFARYDQINRASHVGNATLELPLGSRLEARLRDRFVAGTLDTRIVDPGGEYFFGLGRFQRNDLDASSSVTVGPRLTLELTGALGRVRFQEASSFFDFDTQAASAGIGFELTPNLKAVASYAYDAVPRPSARPEAEASSHAGRVALSGELVPLLTGQLAVGYRRQENPNAGSGGRRYSGLVASGTLTRQLRPDASLTLYVLRSTLVSAYETNGFYVSNALQASALLPLPLELQLRTGLGYQWNDYRVETPEIGRPRADHIVGWFASLRRPVARRLFLSGTYRSERRSSNVARFDATSDGLVIQLEWSALGSPLR